MGRLLVNAEANPSIDSKVGGSKSVIIDIPIKALRVTIRVRLLREENDIERMIVCMAGSRKRLANEGTLEATLKSLRIMPSQGIWGLIRVSLTIPFALAMTPPPPIVLTVCVTHL
jgi:hypothetical protein